MLYCLGATYFLKLVCLVLLLVVRVAGPNFEIFIVDWMNVLVNHLVPTPEPICVFIGCSQAAAFTEF